MSGSLYQWHDVTIDLSEDSFVLLRSKRETLMLFHELKGLVRVVRSDFDNLKVPNLGTQCRRPPRPPSFRRPSDWRLMGAAAGREAK